MNKRIERVFRNRKLTPDEIARDTEVRRNVMGEFTPAHTTSFRSNPMPLPVSLREFVGEMETFGDGCEVYLNLRTGEFFGTTEELVRDAERDDDGEEVPEWEADLLPKVREVMTSADWLPLPSKFDMDEYRIMRDFAFTINDTMLRDDLLDTIGGQGTFGRWKSMLSRRGLLDGWYRYRTDAFRGIAVEWLKAHEIPYRD